MSIKGVLVSFMKENAYKPMNAKELAKIFAIRRHELKDFQKTLDVMEKEGLIVKNRTSHYGVPEKMGLIVGIFDGKPKGFGFVISEDRERDIFIPISGVNGAMHGDKVIVKITKTPIEGKREEGEIEKIVERKITSVIGIYEDSKNFGFVVPEDKKLQMDIFIPKSQNMNAKQGQVVVAKITQYPKKGRNPEGKITEVLGYKGEKGIDILTIIRKFNLPEEFTEKVESYAEGIEDKIPEEEFGRRIDLREKKMVTIDGADAKDLDDAVSIEKMDNGNYKLGVHIADVAHYVKERNPLDKEALKRGTSVYLVDRVIPMLPKKLSNGVCSLNPKVDRLALTCMMEIDNTGKVVSNEVFESIIKTNERMTYSDVTKILKYGDTQLIERYDYLYEDFKSMEELFNILNKKRMSRGAIDFDFEESKIILDKLGKPIDIKPYEREVSNRIIEEFMLVCNETVAEYMFWTNLPFVYRIHEEPNSEKLGRFKEFAHNIGLFIKPTQSLHPRVFQEILEEVKGKKEETVISTLMLRTMMKARYAPECSGHFGLAARYYCHFTSPIRRYPDLMIHRIIKEFINTGINDKRVNKLKNIVGEAALRSSEREKVAMEAEREVDDLKKAEYMKERIGEVYEGIISSVTNFGMFIELSNSIEGLVHISALEDDYYIFDERHFCLIGEHTKNVYRLGDAVKIRVSSVEMDNYDIYFELLSDEEDNEEIEVVDGMEDRGILEGIDERETKEEEKEAIEEPIH
ncbi:ribonuclease R [Oceanirhabdus seepicola]|uniref:Ribonuclease R n=1 Tax=Oceanirhabdus seepicola TaxID=2828781 RepID=A0A9J6P193_9CLOT|nr:ribonuclease R [Oceanirhabdus seepicola]MCM1990180.1 ribonuclease R [Oceanirhabdus seepicola]